MLLKRGAGLRMLFIGSLLLQSLDNKIDRAIDKTRDIMTTITRKGKAPQDPTQCPSGIDLTTYFSPLISEEIKSIIPLLHATPIDTIKVLIDAVFHYLLSHAVVSELNEEIYNKGLQPKEVNKLVTGLYLIIRIALKNKIKLSIIKTDLLKMNAPGPVVEEIVKEVMTSRLPYEVLATQHRVQFFKLEKIRWRIDVVISSGSLSRVMKPNILMQMIMKDGKVFTFEITFEQFSLLRYSVAKVLHDMQTLERHPIIRIVNEFRRREEEDYNN